MQTSFDCRHCCINATSSAEKERERDCNSSSSAKRMLALQFVFHVSYPATHTRTHTHTHTPSPCPFPARPHPFLPAHFKATCVLRFAVHDDARRTWSFLTLGNYWICHGPPNYGKARGASNTHRKKGRKKEGKKGRGRERGGREKRKWQMLSLPRCHRWTVKIMASTWAAVELQHEIFVPHTQGNQGVS